MWEEEEKQESTGAQASSRATVVKTGGVVRVAVAGEALGGAVLEDGGTLAHGQGGKQKGKGEGEEHLGGLRTTGVEKLLELVV